MQTNMTIIPYGDFVAKTGSPFSSMTYKNK